MLILIIGLVFFLGIHSVSIFAPAWRDAQLAKFGENTWKTIYSVISLVGLVLICWGYSLARQDTTVIYQFPLWINHVTALLMLFAIILIVVMSLPGGKIKAAVKHPGVSAVKIWAFAHLLANGDTASIVLFAPFLVWGIVDRISLKKRGAPVPAPGPVKYDIIAIILGIVVYIAFVLRLHYWLFGVMPVTH